MNEKHKDFLRKRILQCIFVVSIFGLGCVPKSKLVVSLKKNKISEPLSISVSHVQVLNHQIIITGTNLNSVTSFKIKEGSNNANLQIESRNDTSIVANTISNVTFAAGKVFDFILSDASASATFTVNFSLCDSSLGGKGFNCSITPNDKEVLSYDAASGKWKPRAVNGLAYLGAWDASSGANPGAKPTGYYYIVGVAGNIGGAYSVDVGDWVVSNGTAWQKIDNSTVIVNVFGRTGVISAAEGDYDLTKLSDVTITAPTTNQVLKYDGSAWVNSTATFTETDPSVIAFAKSALPTCGAGEVLKSDGLVFSCVTDNAGTSFTGAANRVIVTNGAGALAVSAITDTVLGYLSGTTSNIQTQINNKLNSSSFVDWSSFGTVPTIDPSRVNLTTANRVVVTGASGSVEASTTTTTELGYLTGVTSSIQTQLNSKLSSYTETDPGVSAFAKTALPTCGADEVLKSNGTSFSCVTDSAGAGSYTGTQNRLVLTDGTTGALTTSAVTNTEAGYLSGVTSDIQTQLNGKQATINKTTVQDVSKLRVYGANATNYVELTAPTLAGNMLITFPATAGTSGQVLTTDGAGLLSWTTVAAGGATGAAGGDLSGTYPNPTITALDAAKVGGGAVSNAEFSYLDGATSSIQTQLNTKEPTITAGTTAQYLRGDKTLATFANDIWATVLTGLSTATNSAITASDSILVAFGKLQAQISAQSTASTNYLVKNGTDTISGTVTLTNVITASGAGDVVVNSVPLTMTSAVNKTYADGKLDKTTGGTVAGVVTLDNDLRIKGGSNYVTVKGNAASAGYDLILPSSAGTNGQALITNGSGALSWSTIVSSGGDFKADGSIPMTGQFQAAIGTEAAPGISFQGDLNTGMFAPSAGSDVIGFSTNGSERMRISNAGSVGIGTSTPGSSLDVKGSLRLSGSTSGYVGFAPSAAAGATTYTLPTTQGTAGQVLSTNGVATTPTLSWVTPLTSVTSADITNGTITGTDMDFTGANAATSGIVIKDNVGKFFNFACGTTGHIATWSASGWACQAPLGDNLGNHTAISNIRLGSYWLSGDGGNEGIAVDSTGKVGVGVAAPTAQLDVLSTQFSLYPVLRATNNGTGDSGSYVDISNGTSNLMVGITGESAVSHGNYGQQAYSFLSTATTSQGFNIIERATNRNMNFFAGSTASSGNPATLTLNGTTKNVGIGISQLSSPGARLHVRGPIVSANYPFNGYFEDTTTSTYGVGGGVGFLGRTDSIATVSELGGVRGGKENSTNADVSGFVALYTRAQSSTSVTERMRVSSTGNVGIGTNSPTVKLEVSGDVLSSNLTTGGINSISVLTSQLGVSGAVSGFPNASIRNTSVSGVSGIIYNDNTNTGRAFIGHINSGVSAPYPVGTFSMMGIGTALTFGMDANEVMRVHTDGKVGIGTTSPSYTLHVNGSVAGTGAYNALSDMRLKKDIEIIPNSLEKIDALRGVSFNWRKDVHPELKLGDRGEIGVIAQEVKKVFPEAVTVDKKTGILSVAYSMLIAPLIEAVKELFHDSKIFKREIASLKSEIKELKAKNDQMAAYYCKKDPAAPFCIKK